MDPRHPRTLAILGAVIALTGATMTLLGFATAAALFGVGLALFLLGGLGLAAASVTYAIKARHQSAEDAYNAGYELGETHGYTAGRKSIRPAVVQMYTTCHECGEVTPVTHSRGRTA